MTGIAGATGSTSPPASGAATSCSTSSTVTATKTPQTLSVGETCPFAASSSVAINFAGTSSTANADAAGLVNLSLSYEDPSISINGGPFAAAVYGVNTITVTGTNPAGGANTATFLIDLEQSTTPASSSGGLAFTGADLAALVAAALALIVLGSFVVLYTRRRNDTVTNTQA
jgi:hypothetical protein